MIQSLSELRIISEKLYLSCRVSVIQQSELHENRHIFGLWDSFFRFLQQRQLNQRIMFKAIFLVKQKTQQAKKKKHCVQTVCVLPDLLPAVCSSRVFAVFQVIPKCVSASLGIVPSS